MGKHKDISHEKRARVQALLELKLYSLHEIAAKENVSHQTAGKVTEFIVENTVASCVCCVTSISELYTIPP